MAAAPKKFLARFNFEASVNVVYSGPQVCEDDFFQPQSLGEGSTGLD